MGSGLGLGLGLGTSVVVAQGVVDRPDGLCAQALLVRGPRRVAEELAGAAGRRVRPLLGEVKVLAHVAVEAVVDDVRLVRAGAGAGAGAGAEAGAGCEGWG